MIKPSVPQNVIYAGHKSAYCNDKEIDVKALAKRASDYQDRWVDNVVDNSEGANFKFTEDRKLVYKTIDGNVRVADITQKAFGQLCSKVGVPAKYILKCFDSGLTELAISNFMHWSKNCNTNFLVREQDGVVMAVLSDKYVPYSSASAIKVLQAIVPSNSFVPTGYYMDSERMHLRYITKEPIAADKGSNIYAGVRVENSEIGNASLNATYFLYRQVCKNGMLRTLKDSELFRMSHMGEKMTSGKIETFSKSFNKALDLNNNTVGLIDEAQKHIMNQNEALYFVGKAQKALKLSEKSMDKLQNLLSTVYDTSRWGILNGFTELSHDFTLDTMEDIERWAGNNL